MEAQRKLWGQIGIIGQHRSTQETIGAQRVYGHTEGIIGTNRDYRTTQEIMRAHRRLWGHIGIM